MAINTSPGSMAFSGRRISCAFKTTCSFGKENRFVIDKGVGEVGMSIFLDSH